MTLPTMRKIVPVFFFALLLAMGAIFATPPSHAIGFESAKIRHNVGHIVFRATHTGSPEFRRVYIATDSHNTTGYQIGGIGADFMIENLVLYRYPGPGGSTEWPSWQPLATIPVIRARLVEGETRWRVPEHFLASCVDTIGAVFQNEKANGKIRTSQVVTLSNSAFFCPTRTPTLTRTHVPPDTLAPTHTATPTRTPTDTPPPDTTPTWTPPPPDTRQKLLVPAYFYIAADGEVGCQEIPAEDDCKFAPLLVSDPHVRRIVILNPSSHPDDDQRGGRLDGYTRFIDALIDGGNSIVMYIPTNYGQRNINEVKAEVDNFLEWYPSIEGFFFDEMSSQCADAPYYHDLYAYRGTSPDYKLTIANPGTNVPACYANSADILVTFEGNPESYASWSPERWTGVYGSSRFAHLIHTAPEAELTGLVKVWKSHPVQYIYITDDTLSNPWDTIATYWEAEVAAVKTP